MKLRITDAAIAAGYESQQCAASPVVRIILEAALPHIEVDATEPSGPPMTFLYRNWRGEIATRKAVPLRLEFASTEWHPEAQWLLIAWDQEKRAVRSFAIKDINPPVTLPIAVEGKVKALEWSEDSCGNWFSESPFGSEFIQKWKYSGIDKTVFEYEGTNYDTVEAAKAAAQTDYETRILSALISSPGKAANPMQFFSENVDRWGAAEWFDRLAKAIREQDKAVVAKDEISFETYRMIAASSAMTLVRDHEATVRASLALASTALVEALKKTLLEVEEIIFANTLRLGSDEYFRARKLIRDALADAKENGNMKLTDEERRQMSEEYGCGPGGLTPADIAAAQSIKRANEEPAVATVDADAIIAEVFRRNNVRRGSSFTHGACRGMMEAAIEIALSSHSSPIAAAANVEGSPLLDWAVSRWNAEVKNRPLVNKNRRALDDTWRQVIRWAGGEPLALVGPSHSELLALAHEAGNLHVE